MHGLCIFFSQKDMTFSVFHSMPSGIPSRDFLWKTTFAFKLAAVSFSLVLRREGRVYSILRSDTSQNENHNSKLCV